MKYRAHIEWDGTVEADTNAEAETAAFEAYDLGLGITVCEVEPLERGRDEE